MVRRLAAADAAHRIRAELVCCDIYDKVNGAREMTFEAAIASKEWHDVCYWGEVAARLAESSHLDQKVSVDYAKMEQKIQTARASAISRGAQLLGLKTGRHRRG